MKFDIQDRFLTFLTEIDDAGTPKSMLSILKWANENPSLLEDLMEDYRKLNKTAKKEFASRLLHLNGSPDKAMETAKGEQERRRSERSMLSKGLAQLRKGSLRMQLPNGVPCIITRDDNGCFILEFDVQGTFVSVDYANPRGLGDILRILMQNKVPYFDVRNVSIAGLVYRPADPHTKTIFEAVSKNISPYLNIVLTDEDKRGKTA